LSAGRRDRDRFDRLHCHIVVRFRSSVPYFSFAIAVSHISLTTRPAQPHYTSTTRRSGIAVLMFIAMLAESRPVQGQARPDTLSGTVTDSSGHVVPAAAISVKHVVSGQTTATTADTAGVYRVTDLAPGSYEVSVSAEGFNTAVATVTVAPGTSPTLNVRLTRGLSLGDLGFSRAQTQGNAQEQARLDRRSHMLRTHQQLGLITVVPMLATIFAGMSAGGRAMSSTDRDLHAALGGVTTGLYITSASFAVFAPKVSGTETRGQIRLHKALAWIHGPGMILTPILGAMAFEEKSRGERVQGIASAHGTVAIVTASAYGAAILSVSLKF
jgi:hypothetical protein